MWGAPTSLHKVSFKKLLNHWFKTFYTYCQTNIEFVQSVADSRVIKKCPGVDVV